MCPTILNPPPTSLPTLSLSVVLDLGALLHVLNSHRSSVSPMLMYMFQCCSLKSSHPSLLPLSLFSDQQVHSSLFQERQHE